MHSSPAAQTTTVCSARGCRVPAVWALRWNNPKLHEPDRRKTWLACDGHRSRLSEFLGSRGFLRESLPVRQVLDLDSVALREATRPEVDPPTLGPAADPS